MCTVCLSNNTQSLFGWDTGTLGQNLKPLCAMSVSQIRLNLYLGGIQGHWDTTQTHYVHCLSLQSYSIFIQVGHRDTRTQFETNLCTVCLSYHTQSLFGRDTGTQLKTTMFTGCLSNHTQSLIERDTGTKGHNSKPLCALSVSLIIPNLYSGGTQGHNSKPLCLLAVSPIILNL
jgi:hypothetical protein